MASGAANKPNPFIRLKIPFVGIFLPFMNAFVGKKIPFVRIMPSCHGFTIIELLVILSLIAILSALAGPPLINFVKNNRLTASVNGLVSDLNFSRNEAIKRGGFVSVCACSNVGTANPLCSGSSDWSNGWLIFADSDGNGSRQNNETVLRRQGSLPGTNTLKALNVTIGIYDYDPAGRITFDARGTAMSGTGNPVLFAICDDRDPSGNPPWRQVEVLESGLIRSGSLKTSNQCS